MLNTIVKLLDAGYSREEIDKMITLEEKEMTSDPAPVQVKEEPKPVVEEKKEEIPPTYTLTDAQIKQLIQGVAVQTASGTIEMPKSGSEILEERLAAMFK